MCEPCAERGWSCEQRTDWTPGCVRCGEGACPHLNAVGKFCADASAAWSELRWKTEEALPAVLAALTVVNEAEMRGMENPR